MIKIKPNNFNSSGEFKLKIKDKFNPFRKFGKDMRHHKMNKLNFSTFENLKIKKETSTYSVESATIGYTPCGSDGACAVDCARVGWER